MSSYRRSRTGVRTFSMPSISQWARRRPRRAPRTYCRSWRSRRSMSRRLWRSRPVNSCWRAWCKSPTLRRRNWRDRAIPRPRWRPELHADAPGGRHGERTRRLGGEHRGDATFAIRWPIRSQPTAKTTPSVQTLTAKTDEPKKPDTRSTKKSSESSNDTKDATGRADERAVARRSTSESREKTRRSDQHDESLGRSEPSTASTRMH